MPPPPLSSRGRSRSERLPRGPLSAIFSMHPSCGRACASTGGGHVICDAGTEYGCGGVCCAGDGAQCTILVMTRGLPSHTVSVSTCTCTCSWTGVGVLTDFLCDSGARLNRIGVRSVRLRPLLREFSEGDRSCPSGRATFSAAFSPAIFSAAAFSAATFEPVHGHS